MRGILTNKASVALTLLLTTMLLVGGGCRQREITMPRDPGPVKFSVASTTPLPQSASSRAKTDVNNDFTTESQIGLYATKADEVDVRVALPENTNVGYFNPTGSTQWSVIEAGKGIMFLADEQPMNFYAYHPFTAQPGTSVVMETDNASPTLIYTLPQNQSTVQSLTSADLMWGKKFNVSESSGVVNLEFEHKLSKLSFKITSGSDWGTEEVSVSKIELVGAELPKTAKLNISTGNLIVGSETNTAIYSDFAPALPLDLNNSQECQFIAVPAEFTNIDINVTVTGSVSGTQTLRATLAGLQLKSGYLRQITMTIHKTSSVYIMVSPSILRWDVISDILMEAI